MADRSDKLMRDLLDQIDQRLREAERVRSRADQGYRDRPFWPERRQSTRTTAHDEPDDSDSNR